MAKRKVEQEDLLKTLIKHFLMARYDLAMAVKALEQNNMIGGVILLAMRIEKMGQGQAEITKNQGYNKLITQCINELDEAVKKGKEDMEKDLLKASLKGNMYMG